jgi:DNA-binding protein H-NS
MARPTQQKTSQELQAQIDALQKEAALLKKKEVQGVIERVKEAIAFYELTAADLGLNIAAPKAAGKKAARKGAKPGPKPGAKAVKTAAVTPIGTIKFKDSAGHTWSGRGPKPGWFKEALAQGKTLDDLKA